MQQSNQAILVIFNKPFNTLSQFTGERGDSTLADFIDIPQIYPAGRLDKDSEGLMLLTNDGALQHKLSHPKFAKEKTYWVQVEGTATADALTKIEHGIQLKDGLTRPAKVRVIDQPDIWPRHPPIRQRNSIPTTWLELTITEGRNRQVRRMTAAVNLPTLRLIRASVDKWQLEGLKPGEYRTIKLNYPVSRDNDSRKLNNRGKPKRTSQRTKRSR
ncbi:MAG: pseudouridine synthase [Kangiellaceae bacterium]|jgi:23S rRNA pseudouridine2457 synthase|nr:pseudouridine synthase [Kangiellaceae bacterium]